MRKTLLFDLDGTLLNTLEDLRDSTNFALRTYGYPERSLEEVRRFVGNGLKMLLTRAVPQGSSEVEIERALACMKAHYCENYHNKTVPYPGIPELLQRLQQAGCRWIAVNCYDEAEELRAAGVTMNILLLGPQSANIAVDLATLGVTQAVGSIEYARELNRFLAGTGLRLNAHMKLETGMGRTGFDVHDDSHLDEMLEALSLPHLNFTGVFTHFAVSDENGDPYTQLQFSRFLHAIDRMEQASGHHFAIRHCANSGAVINYPQMHLDMVRPGLLLYGVFPAAETGGLDLRPAMSLYSRVSEVTHHHAGDTISYGRTFTCPHDMRLAVLPVGYADGLLRSLSGKGDVLLHGKRAPQVGRICMDMCMVDVTDIPEVQPGDVATIFGADLSVAEQAEKAGTIPYELLCAMSQRVQRVYID